jgi:hypothetical protein
MVGSIERFRRLTQVGRVAPMMLLVIGLPTRPDPINKRTGGTAGIIPIPVATSAASTRSELIAPESRRDARADRGRVLYPDGRVLRDTVAPRTLHRHPCPDQRVVQTHAGAGPTS